MYHLTYLITQLLLLLLSVSLANPIDYDEIVFQPNDGGIDTFGDDETQVSNPFKISWSQFSNAFISNGYPVPAYSEYQIYISRPSAMNAITSRVEMAMFLAQIIHESGGLKYRIEIGCPAEPKCRNYQYASWNPYLCGPTRNQPCNQSPFSPNTLYYGRGYMQLSWPVNYDAASWGIYGDDRLWRFPNLVSTSFNSWATAIWYWKIAVHPDPQVQSGRFGASTRLINGALECWGGNGELARRRWQLYQRVFSAFQIRGAPIENGCYN